MTNARLRGAAIWVSLTAITGTYLHASDFRKSAIGTTSGGFLKLGAGARAMALGEAYSSLADDGTSIYWNPASLAQNPDKHNLTFMHAEYLADIYYDYLGYACKMAPGKAFGAGVQYLSYGKIAETNDSGIETGIFHPQDLAVSLGGAIEVAESPGENGANVFKNYMFGAGVKYVQSQILRRASAMTIDLGILSPKIFNDRLKLGFVAQNIFGDLKYDQVSEPLPFSLRFGAGLHVNPNWAWGLDFSFPRDNRMVTGIGTEYVMDFGSGKPGRDRFAMAGRVGYNTRTAGDVQGFTGASFGIGFISKGLGSLDYALVPFGTLGLTHRISTSVRFGERARRISSPRRISADSPARIRRFSYGAGGELRRL